MRLSYFLIIALLIVPSAFASFNGRNCDFTINDCGFTGYNALMTSPGYITMTTTNVFSPDLDLQNVSDYTIRISFELQDWSQYSKIFLNTPSGSLVGGRYLLENGSGVVDWKHEGTPWGSVSGIPDGSNFTVNIDVNLTTNQSNSTVSGGGSGTTSLATFLSLNNDDEYIGFEVGDTDNELRILSFNVNSTSTLSGGGGGGGGGGSATLEAILLNPTADKTVNKSEWFRFDTNVTCSNANCGNVSVTLDPIVTQSYPLGPDDLCGSSQTCQNVIDRWNNASWKDLVSANFSTGRGMAASRWITTEGTCTGDLCQDQLRQDSLCPGTVDSNNNEFCGVTDEHGNVLLSHSMGTDQNRYEMLHNFTEFLRIPEHNLQCWRYYINGTGGYDQIDDVMCLPGNNDSASDASVRILGAYAIACAKQRVGIWSSDGVDYCADYEEQGKAIFENEVVTTSTGRLFLCASSDNAATGCPTSGVSFRPDYYELQFLMDYGEYKGNQTIIDGVIDMLESVNASFKDNNIWGGKNGHFASDGVSSYVCDELCSPEYMDNIDTWRGVPALSQLYNTHPEDVPTEQINEMFSYWWNNYGGGVYSYTVPKPTSIYSNSADGLIKGTDGTYKGTVMWVPLAAAFDDTYTQNLINYLVDSQYNTAGEQFFNSAYYGGYFSQFAQRAIGSATGLIDPNFVAAISSSKSGAVNTTKGAVPFWTNESNPMSCTLLNNSYCELSWWVNATGTVYSRHQFFVIANSLNETGIAEVESDRLFITINGTVNVTEEETLPTGTMRIKAYVGETSSFVSDFNISVKGINDSTDVNVTSSNHQILIMDNFSNGPIGGVRYPVNGTLWETFSYGIHGPNGAYTYEYKDHLQMTTVVRSGAGGTLNSSEWLLPNSSDLNARITQRTNITFEANYTRFGSAINQAYLNLIVSNSLQDEQSLKVVTLIGYRAPTSFGVADTWYNFTIDIDPEEGKISVYRNTSNIYNGTSSLGAWYLGFKLVTVTSGTAASQRITQATIKNYQQNTTESYAEFNGSSTLSYNTTMIIPGYKPEDARLTLSETILNYIFQLTKEQLYVNFYDEITRTSLNGTNVTVSLIDGVATTQITENGTLNFGDVVPPDEYTIRYWSNDYNRTREYFITFQKGTITNLTLYLINDFDSLTLPFRVIDQAGNPINGAEVRFLRYYTQSNSYEVVEMTRTSERGQGNVYFEPENAWYKFQILVNGEVVKTTTGEKFRVADALEDFVIAVNTGRVGFGRSVNVGNFRVKSDLNYDRASRTFNLEYADTVGIIDEVCLNIYELKRSRKVMVNQTCSVSDSSIILAGHLSTMNEVIAEAMIDVNFQQEDVKANDLTIIDLGGEGFQVMRNLGLFFGALMIISGAMLSFVNPAIPIIMGSVGFSVSIVALDLAFSKQFAIGVIIVAIGLVILMGRRQGQ